MEHPDIKERDQFDLDWKVNTAPGLSRIAYRKIQNLEKGHSYQASWTSEVRNSFNWCRRHLKDDFQRFSFVDVGCGKGKVNLIWQQELLRHNLTQRNVGVDYYEPLLTIARNNWQIMFPKTKSEFYLGDAASYDFRRLGDQLIVYMFNPFSTMVLLEFIRNLKDWPTILIYNVPSCDQLVRASGFRCVDERRGTNQNQTTYTYRNF
jgi:SAM-dependent methyltransferase